MRGQSPWVGRMKEAVLGGTVDATSGILNGTELVQKDLQILVEGNSVILRKYEPNCHFCGGNTGLSSFKGKLVCRRCLKALREL